MCACMPVCFQRIRNLVIFAKARPAQMIFIITSNYTIIAIKIEAVYHCAPLISFCHAGAIPLTPERVVDGSGCITILGGGDGVLCDGNEARLTDCQSSGTGQSYITSCTHRKDIGVRCLPHSSENQ